MFFQKKKKYEMNMDTANTILQNVLASESKAPNTIPFDKLVLRENLNTRFYDRILAVLVLFLTLTFLSPLVVVPMAEKLIEALPPGYCNVVEDYVENERLYLRVEGRYIVFQDAYLETTDGRQYFVLSYDEKKGILCFPFLENTESNIYIPIENAQPLHLLLTPQ